MSSVKLMAGAAMLCALTSACASTEDVRTMRRPPLPPSHVALADSGSALHENIAVYEILGTPEFRLFDGGSVITTRPTRGDVADWLFSWLGSADMLADSIGDADYLLTVTFDDLRGPDVVPFSDKDASGTVRYTLVNRHSRQIVFDQAYPAQFQARMPGVTQEMVRAGIVSGIIGAALAPAVNDSGDPVAAAALLGAALGGDSAAFAVSHDTLLWDWPVAFLEGAPRIAEGLGGGLLVGAAVAHPDGGLDDSGASLVGGVAGGAIGFLAAAPSGRNAESYDAPDTIGAFNGTRRRGQAVRGMVRQSFDRFLLTLGERDMLNIRRAVTCNELNDGSYGIAVIVSTDDAVAYDCPVGPTRRIRS